MNKLTKIIGYTLSIIAIVAGILIIGVGLIHFIAFVSGGFYFVIIGVFLIILGLVNIVDVKGDNSNNSNGLN